MHEPAKRVGARAVFAGAIAGEACALACLHCTHISFLWYNLMGCAGVTFVGLARSPFEAHPVTRPASV